MTKINVAIAPDNNYAKHCAVTMASLLANASESSEVHFFILDGGISDESKHKLSNIDAGKTYKIDFLKIDESDFAGFHGHGYITVSTWYRIKLGSMLPKDIDRILYLDCDIVVKRPLDEMFTMPLDGCIIGASLDCIWKRFNKRIKQPADYSYFNAGVLLIDIGAWRKENVEKLIFDFLNEDPKRILLYDQNVLNILLGNRKKNLGIKWNFQYTHPYIEESYYYVPPYAKEYLDAFKDPAIIHYVGPNKPWQNGLGEFHAFKPEYLKYLEMTPWRDEAKRISTTVPQKSMYLKYIMKKIWRKPAIIFRDSYWGCVKLEKMRRRNG